MKLNQMMTCILGLSLFLSACHNGSGNNSSNTGTGSLQASSAKLTSSASNEDNDLWTNVTSIDTTAKDSYATIIGENSSHFDVQFLGCDSVDDQGRNLSDYVKLRLKDIPHGYTFPRTQDYPAKFSKFDAANNGIYDAANNGIYDAAHIYDNSIEFTNAAALAGKSGKFNCYYQINNPETLRPMFFKLVNNWYVAGSYSAIGEELNKPKSDMDDSYRYLNSQFIGGGITGAISTTAGVAWVATRKYGSLVSYMQRLQDNIQTKYANYINQQLNILNSEVSTDAEKALARNNLIKEFSNDTNFINLEKGSTLTSEEAADLFSRTVRQVSVQTSADGRYKGYFVTDAEGNTEDLFNSPLHHEYKFNEARFTPAERQYEAMVEFKDMGGRVPTSPSEWVNPKVAANDLSTANEARLNAIKENLVPGAVTNEIERGANVKLYSVGEAIGKGIAVDAGIIALDWFLFQPLISTLTGETQATGAFTTGVNHWRIEPISNEEAQRLIAANKLDKAYLADVEHTKIITYSKSSVEQGVKISSTDPNVDSQVAVDLKLQALSTDWNRQKVDYEDAYFADIHRGSNHSGDAAIIFSINDTAQSSTDDLLQQMALEQYDNAGMAILAHDARSNAPTVNVENILNTHSHKLMFKNKLNSLSATVNGKVGQVHGIPLNSGQLLTLDIRAAAPLTASATESQSQSAGGISIAYNGQDESGLTSYVPVKSDYLKAVLDRQHSASGNASTYSAPYLFTKSLCAYPNPIGKSCQVQVGLGGKDDGERHIGYLDISTAGSKITQLPVFINMHLVADNETFNLREGSANKVIVTFSNYGSEDYKSLNIQMADGSSLEDNDIHLESNDCNSLASGASCSLKLDFQDAGVGNYPIVVKGLFVNDTPATKTLDADKVTILTKITPHP